MQSEVRVHCFASLAVFGADDVPSSAVHPSGFDTWLKKPLSRRANEDKRQTDLLLTARVESGKVYGYRKLHDDLLDQGEVCCPNRVARLTRLAGIKGADWLQTPSRHLCDRPSVVVDMRSIGSSTSRLRESWVTDITYIRTCKGSAYLAVRHRPLFPLGHRLSDAMQSRQTTDVVLQALFMAV